MKGNALVLTLTETIGQGVLFLTSPFWSLYLLEMGASLPLVGLLVSIPGFIRILLQAPVGYLTDRKGRKRLVVWGGLIASFAPFIYYFADQWVFLIPGVIVESFTNVVLPARQAMFAKALDQKKRATAFATIHTLFAVASSILPILGGYLLEKMGLVQGMKLAFLISGVVMLISSILRALYLTEDDARANSRTNGFSFISIIKDFFTPVVTIKSLRIALLAAFMFYIASGILTRYSVVYAVDVIGLSKVEWGLIAGGIGVIGIFTRIPVGRMIDSILPTGILTRYSVVYAVDVIGLSKVEWGLIAGGIGVIGIFTRIPVGRMIDSLGRKVSIFLSYATRPFFIIAFIGSFNFLQVLFVLMLDSVFGYIQQPALEAFVIDVSSQGNIGRSYGALNLISSIALAISPLIGAFMWEIFGAVSAFYTAVVFTSIAAIVIEFMKF
ncbi:MFS transporter [Candidatus Bathyarchaeota archaeon]|nr:MFS transporter [Candidatus Bathyarchaeota archaeon]